LHDQKIYGFEVIFLTVISEAETRINIKIIAMLKYIRCIIRYGANRSGRAHIWVGSQLATFSKAVAESGVFSNVGTSIGNLGLAAACDITTV
jgi:hypothetical protein